MHKVYSRNFWLLSTSSYLFFTSFSMIIAELPGYLTSLGGKEYLGLIVSLFTVTAAISRPFSGKLTDLWGRVPVMIIGAVASGIAGLMYPFLATVWGFLLTRLIHGFSTGFKPTGTSAYIADIVPASKRGEALGISSFFGTIGMASGPVLGSYIFLNFGINSLFITSSGFAIGSILILAGMKETLENRRDFEWSMLKVHWHEIFESRALLPSIIMALTAFSFGTLISLSPIFSEQLGIENKGLFYGYFTGSSLLVRILGGRLSDRFGRTATLYFSTPILFASMCIIGLAETQTQFFTGAFIFGIGYGLNSPTLMAWVIDLMPDHLRGRGLSTIYIFMEIGIGAGSFITGTLFAQSAASLPVLFIASGMLALAAFFIVLTIGALRKTQR